MQHTYETSSWSLPRNGPSFDYNADGCDKLGEWNLPAYQVTVPTYWIAEFADEAEVANAIQRTARTLTRSQTTPLYAEMAGAARRFHELPYSLPAEQGIIDALFESAVGWTLVEFKMDHVRDAAR